MQYQNHRGNFLRENLRDHIHWQIHTIVNGVINLQLGPTNYALQIEL